MQAPTFNPIMKNTSRHLLLVAPLLLASTLFAAELPHLRQQGTAKQLIVDGQPFLALNGGPEFKFNESISLQVQCKTQRDIDYFWERLGAGGDPEAQVCGWLKDRYGVSWQIVYERMPDLLADDDPARASRVMNAMLKMKKLDVNEIERAARSGVSSLA